MKNYEALRLDHQLCFPLYAASRAVIKKYYPFLEKIGLTYTQYVAMMVFWEEREVSAKHLGERLFLDSGTVTPLLKSLEAKGLVARERSRVDERVLMARATEAGMALREQAEAIPEKIATCIKLDAQEAKELYRILYKVLAEAEGSQV